MRRHLTIKTRRHMFPTQHGSGFRQSAKNFGKKVVSLGKKGINFILNNAGELATLGKAGYDIYQGREGGEGAMKALQKIQSRIGDKEKEAIASLIKGKKKDIKAEIKAGNVVSAKKDIVELKKLEVVQKTAKAVPPVDILSQIKAGVALKKPKPKVVPPASVPRAKEISSLMEQIQKRRQAMGLNEIKQDNQEDEAEWGSGRRVQKNLMKLVSKNMKKEKKKYKGQLMDTGLISGKNYVVGVGKPKLSSVLGGISGAAGAASMIPYLAPVAAPLSAITGAAGSIAKIFGKGHYKSSKYRSNKMLGKGLSEIASKVRGLISKYGTSSNLELARKIVMSVTGRTPTELVKQVLAKLQSKL